MVLSYQFDHLGELGDLEEAILRHRDAVGLTPNSHPDKLTGLIILGNSFKTRFERIGELSDLEEAISMYRDAVDLAPMVTLTGPTILPLSATPSLHVSSTLGS